MDAVTTELLSSLFLLPESIAIEAVYPTTTHLTIQVACLLKSAACPLCQQSSERIHSSYGRLVESIVFREFFALRELVKPHATTGYHICARQLQFPWRCANLCVARLNAPAKSLRSGCLSWLSPMRA
jgi:hypothetical protein